jgi:hypothetical protein
MKEIDLGIKFEIDPRFIKKIVLAKALKQMRNIRVIEGTLNVGFESSVKLIIQNTSRERLTLWQGTAAAALLLFKPDLGTEIAEWEELGERERSLKNRNKESRIMEEQNESNFYLREQKETDTDIGTVREAFNWIDPRKIAINFVEINLVGTVYERAEIVTELKELERNLISKELGTAEHILPVIAITSTNTSLPGMDSKYREDCEYGDKYDVYDDKYAYGEREVYGELDIFSSSDEYDESDEYGEISGKQQPCQIANMLGSWNWKLTQHELAHLQSKDELIQQIYESIIGNNNEHKHFKLRNGIVCREYDLVKDSTRFLGPYIPTDILDAVVIGVHKSHSHPSKRQTYEEFNRVYYHPRARRAVARVCDACETCSLSKNTKNRNRRKRDRKKADRADRINDDCLQRNGDKKVESVEKNRNRRKRDRKKADSADNIHDDFLMRNAVKKVKSVEKVLTKLTEPRSVVEKALPLVKGLKVFAARWKSEIAPRKRVTSRPKSILKRKFRTEPFPFPDVNQLWRDDLYGVKVWRWRGKDIDERTVFKNDKRRYRRSSFVSSLPGTLCVMLEPGGSHGRVTFNKLEVFFYDEY